MKNQDSVLKYHAPKAQGVRAVEVTEHNAKAIAQELGGEVVETPMPGDPDTVALWLVLPTLGGVVEINVGQPAVVGKEIGSNRIMVWSRTDFYNNYHKVTRNGPESVHPSR